MAKAGYWGGRHFGGRYFGQRYWGAGGAPAAPVDGAHFGNRYFGNRYFGKRYWGPNDREEDFALAETTGAALTGSVTIAGNIVAGTELEIVQTSGITLAGALYTQGDVSYENEDFSITPPIEVSALSGALTVAGDLTIAAPAPGLGRYFGQRYFGHDYWGRRYWSPAENWSLEQTQGVSIAGTTTVAGGITSALAISVTQSIALSGVVTVAGDLPLGEDFDIIQIGVLVLGGGLSLAGRVAINNQAIPNRRLSMHGNSRSLRMGPGTRALPIHGGTRTK